MIYIYHMNDEQHMAFLEDKVKHLQENIVLQSEWLIGLIKLIANLESFDSTPYSKETISSLRIAIDAHPGFPDTDKIIQEQDVFIDRNLMQQYWRLTELTHELRTPLSTLKGICAIMDTSNVNSKQLKYLEIISRNCEMMMILIDNVVDYGKVTPPPSVPQSIKTNIGDLLKYLIDTFELRTENKDLNFTCCLDLKEHIVQVDPTLLSQVIMNLLSNAEKFSVKGEVALKSEILFESGTELSVQISVKDSGIGISKSHLTTVFDAFVQGETPLKGTNVGSGLGLYITKNIIQNMGGEIWATSDVGLGTTVYFTLTLPLG